MLTRAGVLLLLLLPAGVAAGELARLPLPGGTQLTLSRSIANRYAPQAYYDQAMASLPALYPRHVLVLERRVGRLGRVDYSLIGYRQTPDDTRITLGGMAVIGTDAWSFQARVAAAGLGQDLLLILETLARLPDGLAGSSP